ncbi:hypothetical protein BX600DRAFT_235956 [Xylariales sp. PMI_506]|nr:hypothetical protein BX600DRAFT_235956 [Xylariales sp. PMI_506]
MGALVLNGERAGDGVGNAGLVAQYCSVLACHLGGGGLASSLFFFFFSFPAFFSPFLWSCLGAPLFFRPPMFPCNVRDWTSEAARARSLERPLLARFGEGV